MNSLNGSVPTRQSSSSSSSKALKYFVIFFTPIVLLQLLMVYKFMLSSRPGLHGPVSIATTNVPPIANQRSVPRKDAGSFNGFPITYEEVQENEAVTSQVHCIGESYQKLHKIKRNGVETINDMSWQSRSCHFQFFCYDMENKEYIIYQDPSEEKALSFPKHTDVSQTYLLKVQTQEQEKDLPYGISIGGINGKWTHQGIPRMKWYPTIKTEPPKSFYALPRDVVMIPFHSLASFNPGHLVWDDFLPLYTLMHIFGFDHLKLLAMRYILPGDGLWASCDWRTDRNEDCQFMLKKFGTLMVSNPDALPFSTQKEPRVELTTDKKSNLVCAKQGLAGIGALTDHGTKKGHGWEMSDYKLVHNSGRGGQLWRFRNFMLKNLGVPATDAPPQRTPLKIIFSEKSSKAAYRSFDWTSYIEALKKTNLGSDVVIEKYEFKAYSLKQQVEIIQQAAIFVTAGGGGAVTATFLSRGASVILFYGSDTGLQNGRRSYSPARLDFDYFNNMAYVRAHWIGLKKNVSMSLRGIKVAKEHQEEIDGFVTLIKHDLDMIRKERIQWEKKQQPSTAQ